MTEVLSLLLFIGVVIACAIVLIPFLLPYEDDEDDR